MKIVFRLFIGALLFLTGLLFVINFFSSTGSTVLEHYYSSSDFPEPDKGKILKGQKRNFEIVAYKQYLGIVAIRFNTFQNINNDFLVFRIKEKGEEQWYAENEYNVQYFLQDQLFTFGIPPIPDSKGKKYTIELESLQGTPEDAVALSAEEPVLVTKHRFELPLLLSDKKLLQYFVTEKVAQIIKTPGFILSVTMSFVPLFLYVWYLFLVSKRKSFYIDIVKKFRNVWEKTDEFFLLHKNSSFPELDGIRAWAIFMVIMAHTGPWLMSMAQEHSGTTKFISNGILAVLVHIPFVGISGGGTGVDLFFVLSGFLIVMTIHNKTSSVLQFMVKRYKRLLPVHVVLIFGTLPTLSIIAMVLNLVFLVDLFPLYRNVNLLTWTLTYEILFYSICALWFITWKDKKFLHTWKFFFVFVFVLYASQWVFQGFLASYHIKYPEMNRFIAFFFGVALAKLYFSDTRTWKKLKRIFYHAAFPGLFIIMLFRYSYDSVISGRKFGIVGVNADFLLLDIGIFLLVGSMLVKREHIVRRFFRMKALRIIGVISYSMYLSHYHLALPMARNLVNGIYVIPVRMLAFVVLSFLISISLSIFLFHFLEKPYFVSKVQNKNEKEKRGII